MSDGKSFIEEIEGGITAPRGFRAAGIHCGIKQVKKDLALIVSDVPATGAGVFTQNAVPAAPVLLDRKQFARSSRFRAIVVNSGNANACTGERGMSDACSMLRATAQALGSQEEEILVSSTGVIGQFLPMENVLGGIRKASGVLTRDDHASVAEAILTTDTFIKECAVRTTVGGVPITIAGIAKGSGMIAPNMATMLAFVATDANVPAPLLHSALRITSEKSFNRITVDGDTSTNDMAIVLANGLAGNPEIAGTGDPAFTAFSDGLEHVLIRLSKMIVMDGEGATKFVEILVEGAASEGAAVRAARAIASSNLVKTAMNGEDANWGRILAAVGNSGIIFTPEEVEIHIGRVPILRRNYHIDFSEEQAREELSKREIAIRVNLNQGAASAIFWTCDLSKQYVEINANYRT